MTLPASARSLFRPDGDGAPSTKRMIQRHRLLALLGTILVLGLGDLYHATNPDAVTSAAARLGIAGLFLGLFGVSYVSGRVRRQFPLWLRGVLYVLVAWFTAVAGANGFSGDYDMGFLLVYAILPGVVAMEAKRMRPVVWFLGIGFLLGTAGVVLGPASPPTGIAVLSSIAAVAAVEGIALQAHLSTEEELREREERLQGLANSLPGVVFQAYVRPDDTYESHFISEHADSLLGIPAEPEHFHERFAARIPDSHRDAFLASIDAAATEETPWRQEVPYEMPSGERRWLLCASTPQRRDEGTVFNGVILDITERKEAERALRDERNRFETLFESLPTPVVRCTVEDEGTLIADANGAFEKVFGVDVDTVEGQDANELLLSSDELPPEEQELASAIDYRVLETESMRAEVRRAAAGGLRDFQLQAAGRTPADGPPELYAIYTDITQKKQYERELEKLTTRLQLALEATDTGFWEWDLRSNQVFLDEACEQLLDYAPGTFPGHYAAFADRVHPEDLDAIEEAVEHAIESGERYQTDFRLQIPDGPRRWIQSRGIVEYDEDDEPQRIIGIQTDVTDRKRRAQELLAAKEEAEEANRLKSAFLANMSHEIRTPLTSIIGFAEAIGDEVDPTAEGTVPRFAGLIEESGRQLLDTLNAVLNLSKLEAGEMKLAAETVDLGTQAEEVAEQLRPQAEKAGVDLHMHTCEVPARADTGGLQVVLRNLISNAIKYTPAHGQVCVRTRWTDEAPVFEVEDTGIGMHPEQVPVLFEPFRQASEGTCREYEGTGLGLAVTKRMVNQMTGEIEVDTEKGAGTCFTVRLPPPKDVARSP